jgi:hypothetical protein
VKSAEYLILSATSKFCCPIPLNYGYDVPAIHLGRNMAWLLHKLATCQGGRGQVLQ